MKDFELIFYTKANGECPVSDFLTSLNKVMRFKLLHQLDLLELYGNHPKGDFTKPLGDGLFEVRAQNKTDITRILFFFDKNKKIILTHGFVKKTQRMPASELDTAKRYRADYFSRAKEQNAADKPEKNHVTIGPQWRPRLDDLVADASARQMTSSETHEKTKDRGAQHKR